MKYIDIHAHMNFDKFDFKRDQIFSEMKEKEIGVINVGTGIVTSKEILELSNKYENTWAIVGLHPVYVNKIEIDDWKGENFEKEKFEKILDHKKIVGIGECGLDYFHIDSGDSSAKKKQIENFEKQIELSIEKDLPIMIHCRNAYSEALEILEFYKKQNSKLRGNMHFFSGNEKHINKLLDLNFSISFTGVVTFAKEYVDLVNHVPIERMHVETDSPYVSPVPNRGQLNTPLNIPYIVDKISKIKKMNSEEFRKKLIKNVHRDFNLK